MYYIDASSGEALPPPPRPKALVEVADTVTEMVNVRHAYDSGIRARRGIDF